jgi:predicted dehydrogenase
MQFGLIGFGALAENYYVPALRRLSDASVVAVADSLPARQSAASARLPQAAAYANYEDLLAREKMDGILVATPPSTHLSIWNAAAKRGLPVFMEKPFLLGGELERAESSARARKLLMVNFNRRFWPVYQRLGELVRNGQLGETTSVEMTFQLDVLKWPAVTPYRVSGHDGGVLYDLGSHALDLIPYLLQDEPLSLQAEAHSHRWESDHIEVSMAFRSGLRFRCTLAYQSPTLESVTVRCSRGSLWLDNPNMIVHVRHSGATNKRLSERVHDLLICGYRGLRQDRSLLRYSIQAALAAFVNSLNAGVPFSPGFDEAVQNARLLEAARQAMVSRKTIDLQTKHSASVT